MRINIKLLSRDQLIKTIMLSQYCNSLVNIASITITQKLRSAVTQLVEHETGDLEFASSRLTASKAMLCP